MLLSSSQNPKTKHGAGLVPNREMQSTPSLKFRWYSTMSSVAPEMVRAEQSRSGDTLLRCKSRLEAKTTPVLQQMHKADDGSEVWINVESVLEILSPAPSSQDATKDAIATESLRTRMRP